MKPNVRAGETQSLDIVNRTADQDAQGETQTRRSNRPLLGCRHQIFHV